MRICFMISDNATIHTYRLDAAFTIISNSVLEDKTISWAAKGLHSYLISRPKDWNVKVSHLSKIYTGKKTGSGRDAIKHCLKELKDAGYVTYKKTKGERGRWVHRYDVYPVKIKEFQKISPETGFPATDFPETVKPSIIPNTDLPSTYKKATTPTSSKKEVSSSSSIFDCLKEVKISDTKKIELTRDFSEELVKNAVEYTQTHTLKTTLLRTLFWHCRNAIPPEEKRLPPLQEMAFEHNELYKIKHPTIFIRNQKLIYEGKMWVWEKEGFVQISIKSPDIKNLPYEEKELKKEFSRARKEYEN